MNDEETNEIEIPAYKKGWDAGRADLEKKLMDYESPTMKKIVKNLLDAAKEETKAEFCKKCGVIGEDEFEDGKCNTCLQLEDGMKKEGV